MLTEGVGILVTALAATVMLVWLVATIVQCRFRRPAQLASLEFRGVQITQGLLMVMQVESNNFWSAELAPSAERQKAEGVNVVVDAKTDGDSQNKKGLSA